jgi:hypothetical protein
MSKLYFEQEKSPKLFQYILFVKKGDKSISMTKKKVEDLLSQYLLSKDSRNKTFRYLRILNQINRANALLRLGEYKNKEDKNYIFDTVSATRNLKYRRLANGIFYFRIKGSEVIPDISDRPEDNNLSSNEVMVEVKFDKDQLINLAKSVDL